MVRTKETRNFQKHKLNFPKKFNVRYVSRSVLHEVFTTEANFDDYCYRNLLISGFCIPFWSAKEEETAVDRDEERRLEKKISFLQSKLRHVKNQRAAVIKRKFPGPFGPLGYPGYL